MCKGEKLKCRVFVCDWSCNQLKIDFYNCKKIILLSCLTCLQTCFWVWETDVQKGKYTSKFTQQLSIATKWPESHNQ